MIDREWQKIVADGYNEIAQQYDQHREQFDNWTEIEQFVHFLEPSSCVLDLGCGAGRPVLQSIVNNGHTGVGLDISDNMLALARSNVSKSLLVRAPMDDLSFKNSVFDGLIATYSIIHVKRELHEQIFREASRVLKPDGIMLVSIGSSEWEDIDEYLGAKMFWSHYEPQKSLELIKAAGFETIYDRHVRSAGEEHYWVLGRNRC
jgi:ubiquinone/menaquinone biosynthesis C-methylase UbiE